MSFTWPLVLIALAAIPVLVAIYIDRDRRRVAAQAEFGNPDLLPNVVDREPGRLRYLPPLIMLVALAFLIVGVARPHATVSVPREEATIVLAMDVSRSMKATDVEPTRLDAARTAAKTFLDEVPEKFRVGVVSFATRASVGVAPTEDRELVVTALDTLAPGEGTAIGDAVALSLRVGQPQEGEEEQEAADAPPRAIVVISDGARDGGQVEPAEAAQQAKRRGVPVHTVLVGTPEGTVEEQLTGGFRRIIRVPPNPETLEQVAADLRRHVLRGARRGRSEPGVRGARLSARFARGGSRDDRRLRRDRGRAAVDRRNDLRVPVQEGAVRLRALWAGVVVAAALAVAAPAGGANECDGLMVCIPVAGPWVVVPASTGAQRERVEFQLTCPQGYIVGGTDARLSVRAIDVGFIGTVGSPVNPGITTSRSAVFLGTYVGRGASAPTFKPFVGCMPQVGGGSRVPTSVSQVRPGRPVTRRAKTVRVRPGTTTIVQRCSSGERLVGGTHAFGFETRTPPSASLVGSVSGAQRISGERVIVRVSGDAELAGVRAVVQVQALCTRAS